MRIAAEVVLKNIDSEWKRDSWPAVSYLYAGAICQLRAVRPMGRGDIPALGQFDGILHFRKPLMAHSMLKEISSYIVSRSKKVDSSREFSAIARPLVLQLGHCLYFRLCYLLERDMISILRGKYPRGFQGDLGDNPFRLVPGSYQSGQTVAEEALFKDEISRVFPEDGHDPGCDLLLPRHVRVLFGKEQCGAKVSYLDLMHPESNRLLGSISAREGVGLAALPLHPRLSISVRKHREYDDDSYFQVTEPDGDQWPEGWREHLNRCLDKCVEKKVAIAVLPEFQGFPRVVDHMMQYLKSKHSNENYPFLIAAGSTHFADEDGIYNRMPLYAANGDGTYDLVMHHDKFCLYTDGEREECCEQGSALTFLVTAIGIVAFGICKDWLLHRHGEAGQAGVLKSLLPTIMVFASHDGQYPGYGGIGRAAVQRRQDRRRIRERLRSDSPAASKWRLLRYPGRKEWAWEILRRQEFYRSP